MKKKKVVISAVAVVAVVGITVGIILAVKSKGKEKTVYEEKQKTESQSVQIEDLSEPENKKEDVLEIEDDGTGLKPDESVVSEVQNNTGVKAEAPAKAKQPEKAEDAAQPVAPNNNNNNDYVQMADPNTGISYDGKSPIIYTYEDGSKGTEKKKGASYEVIPGLIRYYYPPDEIPWDGTCSHCGKVAGDGLNGTCVRWLMGDMTCPNCGTFVKKGECHTCK